MKEYVGFFYNNYQYCIKGSNREWSGYIVDVPQIACETGISKYRVKASLRKKIRKYFRGCLRRDVKPQRPLPLPLDKALFEEAISLNVLVDRYGAVFTDVMWLFSNEGFVFKKYLWFLYLDPSRVQGGRLRLLINTTHFGGECSVRAQPYPDDFTVAIDNSRRVIDIHFYESKARRKHFAFSVDIATRDGLRQDVIDIFSCDDGENYFYYGFSSCCNDYFFSVNEVAFDFFREVFRVSDKFTGSEIKKVSICAHAFVNATIGMAFFPDTKMSQFLKYCVNDAVENLKNIYFRTKYFKSATRLFRRGKRNWQRGLLQWFDSTSIHDGRTNERFSNIIWRGSRGRGDALERLIIEAVSLKYEGVSNKSIYAKIREMAFELDREIRLKHKILHFAATENESQKITNFLKSNLVRDFADKNLFPRPVLDKKNRKNKL